MKIAKNIENFFLSFWHNWASIKLEDVYSNFSNFQEMVPKFT